MAEPVCAIRNTLSEPFWEAAGAGRLVLPWCIDSARAFWPPSPISPWTGGGVDWRSASPVGTLLSIVIYRRPFQRAFADRLPYGIGLVALDAGPRLQAHLVDPEYPSAPQPDDRVSLGFAALLADAAPILTIRSVA